MSSPTPSPLQELSAFGSRSVTMHLLRGLFGFALLGIALAFASQLGWWTILPVVAALVLFRGCPTCWTAGLIETVLRRRKKGGEQSCVDGSCAKG